MADFKKFKFLGIDAPGEYTYDSALKYVDNNTTDPYWQSLTKEQKLGYLKKYTEKDTDGLWSGIFNTVLSPLSLLGLTSTNDSIDVDSLLADLSSLSNVTPFDNTLPKISDYVQSSDEIYKGIDSEISGRYDTARSRLDSQQDIVRKDYLDQANSLADLYNSRTSTLLSNQYRTNAQTFDTLQSDMRKARQNALEAGASAGIRIAGNVNSLLSAQNKQSQTAMDTSNALAEMLLQQRNAASGLRSDYHNYMSNLDDKRTDLDMQQASERETLYNQRYNTQLNDYGRAVDSYNAKEQAWNNQFDDTNKLAPGYKKYILDNNK